MIDENTQETLDSAQESYYNALQSGDQLEIEKSKATLDKFFSAPEASVEPSPQQEVQEQPVEEEKPATATEGADEKSESDWLQSLPENIRGNVEQLIAQNKYLDQYKRSNEGRVSGLQRKADEAERKLREIEAMKAQAQPAPQQTSSVAENNAKINELTDQINQLKNSDPELAKVLGIMRDALLDEATRLRNEVPKVDLTEINTLRQRLQEQEEFVRVERARSELDRLVPNATQIIDSPHWVEFTNTLSPSLRAAIQSSDDPMDYVNMMPLYAQWAETYNRAHGMVQPANAVNPPAQVDPRVAATQANRTSNLQAGVPVQARTVTPPQPKPTEAEILRTPSLLMKRQEEIYQETLKKMGLA